jgi:membrane protein DedA with SNARE-associated domain
MATVSPGRSRGGRLVSNGLSESIIGFLSQQDSPVGLLVLASAAALEYVFPPFPGDSITLFGAVLITAYDWSLLAVYASVMAGSVAGSMAAYHLGGALQRRGVGRRPKLDVLVARFRRHGAAYLLVNRFLPGFRAVFFVAAGLAEIPARSVALYAAISAAVWNALVIAVGALLGANFDRLEGLVRNYVLVLWVAAAAVLAVAAIRWGLRRRRAR